MYFQVLLSLISSFFYRLTIKLEIVSLINTIHSMFKQYKETDERIRLILKDQNTDAYDTMNTLIDNTVGDFLSIVDSNDYIAENYIEDLYDLI